MLVMKCKDSFTRISEIQQGPRDGSACKRTCWNPGAHIKGEKKMTVLTSTRHMRVHVPHPIPAPSINN